MKSSELRRRLAVEAARLASESGSDDLAHALGKAARKLGARDRAAWPDDAEIREALAEHQRLFRGPGQSDALQRLRRVAREAMRFLAAFEPRLHGAVLDGTADIRSTVRLHLHTDEPEAVDRFLIGHSIPYTTRARRITAADGQLLQLDARLFEADDAAFDATILPLRCLAHGPLRAAGGSPLPRTDLAGLERLLQSGPR